MERSQDELIEHLFANSIVNEETGCILWQGCIAGKGYGVVGYQGRQQYVHRLAYQFQNPDEVLDIIRHTCDTPNCWRIDHLVNGTTLENVHDMIAKKRHMHGESNYNTHLTNADIVEIRNSDLNLYRLAEKFNITASNVFYIQTRKTWRHVA